MPLFGAILPSRTSSHFIRVRIFSIPISPQESRLSLLCAGKIHSQKITLTAARFQRTHKNIIILRSRFSPSFACPLSPKSPFRFLRLFTAYPLPSYPCPSSSATVLLSLPHPLPPYLPLPLLLAPYSPNSPCPLPLTPRSPNRPRSFRYRHLDRPCPYRLLLTHPTALALFHYRHTCQFPSSCLYKPSKAIFSFGIQKIASTCLRAMQSDYIVYE